MRKAIFLSFFLLFQGCKTRVETGEEQVVESDSKSTLSSTPIGFELIEYGSVNDFPNYTKKVGFPSEKFSGLSEPAGEQSLYIDPSDSESTKAVIRFSYVSILINFNQQVELGLTGSFLEAIGLRAPKRMVISTDQRLQHIRNVRNLDMEMRRVHSFEMRVLQERPIVGTPLEYRYESAQSLLNKMYEYEQIHILNQFKILDSMPLTESKKEIWRLFIDKGKFLHDAKYTPSYQLEYLRIYQKKLEEIGAKSKDPDVQEIIRVEIEYTISRIEKLETIVKILNEKKLSERELESYEALERERLSSIVIDREGPQSQQYAAARDLIGHLKAENHRHDLRQLRTFESYHSATEYRQLTMNEHSFLVFIESKKHFLEIYREAPSRQLEYLKEYRVGLEDLLMKLEKESKSQYSYFNHQVKAELAYVDICIEKLNTVVDILRKKELAEMQVAYSYVPFWDTIVITNPLPSASRSQREGDILVSAVAGIISNRIRIDPRFEKLITDDVALAQLKREERSRLGVPELAQKRSGAISKGSRNEAVQRSKPFNAILGSQILEKKKA